MQETKETTIAIVDDDPAVLDYLKALLHSAGYEVIAYPSAVDVIERNNYDRIDCMILDVRMPEIGGLQLQEILNALGYTIPIIFITGFATEWTEQIALEQGAAAFFHKPFDEQALIEAVQRSLNGK